MLWHFLIEATHGTWSTFIAMLLDTLLELFYRRRGSTFNIFTSQPHTVSIMFHIWWIWGPLHVVERLIRYPCHALLPIWRCGVVHCDPGTQKLTEVYEIYPELTGEVLAHDIRIIFLVDGSRNLQQMTKMTFSSLLFVLECMVRKVTAFYSGCWYIATQSVLQLSP